MARKPLAVASWGIAWALPMPRVRKDLAHFGQFGHPGVGYRASELIKAIRIILGTDRQWQVALVGVGNLGRAPFGVSRFFETGIPYSGRF